MTATTRTTGRLRSTEGEALADAIEHGDLELHYQPQIHLDAGIPVGLEALVRWRRDGRLIGPADFLPTAQAEGLISALTAWVMRTAAQQIAEWQERVVINHGFRISVNVPASEFAGTRLVSLVRGVLDTYGLAPGDLVVELTESDRLAETDGAAAEAQALRSILGVDLSLDDFGTGWSSIALLHQVGAEELKVERSFVQDLANPTCRTLVEAMVRMARNLGMRVVAEGVETVDQLQRARDVGCDIGQGWLWGPAVPPDEVEALLAATDDMARAAVA